MIDWYIFGLIRTSSSAPISYWIWWVSLYLWECCMVFADNRCRCWKRTESVTACRTHCRWYSCETSCPTCRRWGTSWSGRPRRRLQPSVSGLARSGVRSGPPGRNPLPIPITGELITWKDWSYYMSHFLCICILRVLLSPITEKVKNLNYACQCC